MMAAAKPAIVSLSSGAANTSPAGIAPATSANASTSQTWSTAKLTLNASTGEITASFEGKTTVGLKDPLVDARRKLAATKHQLPAPQ